MFRRMLLATALLCAIAAPSIAQGDLSKPGELKEQAFGPENAPVTVIEYASLTCHHCRDFHINDWPAIREKYVNTGKVRFIMREFPLDQLATAGFMLARCSGDLKWYLIVDALYKNDDMWAHAPNPLEGLRSVMKQTGMLNEAFETCLRDTALQAKVEAVRTRGQAAGVSSTPTFFINGEKHEGRLSLEEFSKIVDPLIEKRQN